MITVYCFQSNNHHVVAAALRMITYCTDHPPTPVVWQTCSPSWSNEDQFTPSSMQLATSYHIAPPSDGWVVAYPNVAGYTPFAAALSRQARKLTVGLTGTYYEAWRGGHPVDPEATLPTDMLDHRYFQQLIVPPVANWTQWLHLWSPNWQAPGAHTHD